MGALGRQWDHWGENRDGTEGTELVPGALRALGRDWEGTVWVKGNLRRTGSTGEVLEGTAQGAALRLRVLGKHWDSNGMGMGCSGSN